MGLCKKRLLEFPGGAGGEGSVVNCYGRGSTPGPGISICGNNEDFYYAAFLKRSQKIKKKFKNVKKSCPYPIKNS